MSSATRCLNGSSFSYSSSGSSASSGSEDPSSHDRGVPRHLVGVGVVLRRRRGGVRLGRGLDGVEVDVLEAVALLLVVLERRALALVALRLLADAGAERRVLAAVGVADDEARVAVAGLGPLDRCDRRL